MTKQKNTNNLLLEFLKWLNFLKWFRFALVFGVGGLLVYGFTSLIILSNPNDATLKATYLSLTLAGALGGIMYSISVDGSLELPKWGDEGYKVHLGSIGEMFLGICGAFIAFLVLPQELKEAAVEENTQGIVGFVTGLVGGYGGKAILNAALGRLIGQVKKVDLVEENNKRLAREAERLNQEQSVIKRVNKQLQEGLPNSEVYNLVDEIKSAPQEIQQETFTRAKEIRRMSWRTKAFKSEIPKTIPIFEALVESHPSNHQYHAQLGYAYKDSIPPRLEEAISEINEAISLRGNQIVGTTWKYELNRALARMMQEEQQVDTNGKMSPWREEIWDDIVNVDRNYGITKVLIESQDEAVDIPLKDWLEENQDWVRQQSGGTRLLEKAFNVALSSTPLIEPHILGENGGKIGVGGFRKDVETLKEEAQSGSVGTKLLRRKRSSKSDLLRKNTNWKRVPHRTKIEATHLTHLKRYTIDSSELPDDQKVEVPVGGHYYVRKYAPAADGHYLVELDYEYGVWYIWPNHWHLPWQEDNTVQPLQTSFAPVFRSQVSQTRTQVVSTLDRWDQALTKALSISTGASSRTAGQDGLTAGVAASQRMAQTDWPKIEKYKNRFYEAAVKYDVPPAIIAAICSRESRGGSALARNGTGDHGKAFGLMQVDRRHHSQAGSGGDPGSQIHINQGTKIYADYRNTVKRNHPSWEDEYLLKGAAAAYNYGTSNVKTKAGIDRGTTGDDYGSDIIARANFYTTKLKSLAQCKAEKNPDVTVNENQSGFIEVMPSSAVSLSLQGSVGRGGNNNAEDVIKVKQRLEELGFDWFKSGSQADRGLIQAINLFQSIINGKTAVRGDGRIDVGGKTHQWLQASNAPRWIEMPIEGTGFINYERRDKNDHHDYGTSWLSDAIIEAGKHYETNHRRGNSNISPIPINDISLIHGGDTPDHGGHECGNACDIYLPRKDGKHSLPTWQDGRYDRNAARAIIKALMAQPVVKKDRIFFNDTTLIGEGLCKQLGGHHHHIHFEVGVPKKKLK